MVMRALPLLLLLLLPPQESSDKAMEKLYQFMDAGHYQEGRAIAESIVRRYPRTKAAELAKPYTLDNAFLRIAPIEVNGPASNRIDLSVMADGLEYENKVQERWEKEADLIFKTFFASELLKEYAKYFNLYRIHVASKTSKLNKADGPVLTFFKSREDDGEILTDGFTARDIAALTGANDRLAIVQVRPAGDSHGISGYGMAVVGSPRPTPAQILHAFGHALGGLGDECTTHKGWYGMDRRKKEPPPIPTAPNISETKDPAGVPWAHWLRAKKEGDKRAAKIDVIEGAALRPTKAWRPVDENQCVMNDGQEYCPVCRETLLLLLYSFVRPIDDGMPFDKVITVESGKSVDLWVLPLAPATHRLVVGWYVEKAGPGDKAGEDAGGRKDETGILTKVLRCPDGQVGPRNGEGPAWRAPRGDTFDGAAKKVGEALRETLTLNNTRVAPGRYKVTAVARDLTEWVLKDSQNLLADWRSWIVEIK
jgi:IgA peptidase M64